LNQILPRLLKLFPKATRTRDSQGRNCLEVGLIPPGDSGGGSGGNSQPTNSPDGKSVSNSYNSEACLNVSEASLNQLNPSASNSSEAPEADPTISRLKICGQFYLKRRTQLLKELGLEKKSGVSSPNQLQLVQNQDTASDTVSSAVVQTPSEQVQNHLNYPPQCKSWLIKSALPNLGSSGRNREPGW
jgi:hypothetical protein